MFHWRTDIHVYYINKSHTDFWSRLWSKIAGSGIQVLKGQISYAQGNFRQLFLTDATPQLGEAANTA